LGYTVVEKGTTSSWWLELLREAEIYRVLQQAQDSAVPVFLGAIDLDKIYFLHGVWAIRHMLLVMGWEAYQQHREYTFLSRIQ